MQGLLNLLAFTTALAFAPSRRNTPAPRPLSKWNLASAVADEPATTSTTADDHDLGAWLPVHSVSALTGLGPQQVEILGQNYAVWQSGSGGEWSVTLDACPHRLAPLSQGRVDANGCLECPYHGWQFDSSGALTKIPQGTPETTTEAGATTLPSMVCGDLIWAFFSVAQTGERGSIDETPWDLYPYLSDTMNKTFYHRELAYSWDVFVCVEIKILRRVQLNYRVDLHAIDATPARWRGDAGSSPLVGDSNGRVLANK